MEVERDKLDNNQMEEKTNELANDKIILKIKYKMDKLENNKMEDKMDELANDKWRTSHRF